MMPDVIHNKEAHRFEVRTDDGLATLEYQTPGNKIIFTHTEVPRPMEGQGIAGLLAKTGLNYAKDNELKIMPLCPFVAGYIRRHPEWREHLLAGFNV